jgi:hypothetical protein
MQTQTLAALHQTINKVSNVEEYNVREINGVQIVGPMKWIILVLGPNHQAKDLGDLLRNNYKNLNIIVLLVTNTPSTTTHHPSKEAHKSQAMSEHKS